MLFDPSAAQAEHDISQKGISCLTSISLKSGLFSIPGARFHPSHCCDWLQGSFEWTGNKRGLIWIFIILMGIYLSHTFKIKSNRCRDETLKPVVNVQINTLLFTFTVQKYIYPSVIIWMRILKCWKCSWWTSPKRGRSKPEYPENPHPLPSTPTTSPKISIT